ncbi:MAG: hypothetical protein GXC94_17370, partial [Comamonadaceae bacterium]|nr:hypothetical protein [Comamonadaceae bacterium]
MKFPKSMHAEGFYDHIDTTASSAPGPRLGPKGVKPGVRPVTARSLWHEEAAVVPPSATAAPALAARPDGAAPRSAAPWIVGAGVCIALVGLAVVTSRNLSGPQPLPAAAVVGQVEPSPQEAQLQSAPPAA